jgi:hypothetical protein
MGIQSQKGVTSEEPYHESPPIVPDSRNEVDMARAMARRIRALRPASGADALRALRAEYPDSPLTLRVAALDLIMRKRLR